MTDPMWHVTSSLNRASIQAHGLDVARMGVARGVAGSDRPEEDGIFLCRDEEERDWFCGFHTDGRVDVWSVRGVDPADLVDAGSGHCYLPSAIPSSQLELVRADIDPVSPSPASDSGSGGYRSSLTITLNDGTVLCGDQADAWIQRQRD